MLVQCGSLALLVAFTLIFSRILLCTIVGGVGFDFLNTLGVGVVVLVVVAVGTVLVSSCTLGFGAVGWIVLSMVAFSIDGRLVVRAGVVGRVVGTLLSFGGAVSSSKMTCLCCS